MKLSDEQGKKLLELARYTLESRLGLQSEQIPVKELDETVFSEKRGVFVTLKKKGSLRGCIGNIEPVRTLFLAVKENSVSAAFFDSRFSSLTIEELEDVTLSISILTPPEKLLFSDSQDLLNKLNKGSDGVILRKGRASATFLPQVWEQLPTREQFLSHLCQKAGLSPGCWKNDDIEVEVYRVQSFSEDVT